MKMDNLWMFCRVVEEGSITKAARVSYVSQPAVTRKIRQLENSYGTNLFDREEGKLKLSQAGKFLYPYAKEILALNKKATEEIQEHLGKMEKTLYVGASQTIGEYLLPSLIGQFQKRYPDITFSLSIGNTPLMFKKLEVSEIDVALIEGVFTDETFVRKKFADDELILVTNNKHRWVKRDEICIDELPEEKMIFREKDSGTRIIVEGALEKQNILNKIDVSLELGSMQAIKSAVEAGLGVSILPELTVQKELKYHILKEIKIKDFYLMRDFWIVQRQQRFKTKAEENFVRFLMR